MTSTPAQSYVASDDLWYRYPKAGDPKPPGGAQVWLLTKGGVSIRGTWSDSGAFLAWCPMPKRNKEKEKLCNV